MRVILYSSLLLLLTSNLSWARYMRPDLEKVPVKTLIANLEKNLESDSGSKAETHHHLARAYGMAYSKNLLSSNEFETNKKSGKLWFGFAAPFVPYARYLDKNERNAEATKFLEQALKHYGAALKLQPNDATMLLGHGWCLEQAGKKDEAVTRYRTALEEFWKKDGQRRGVFGPVGTYEGVKYLVPLLDPAKDKAEIDKLNARVAKLKSLPRAMTPIAIPLHSNATLDSVFNRKASVTFDADGSGLQSSWNWIHGDAGWLVYDNKGTGKIDTAIQFFGNRTFMLFLEDGYAAMRLLDSNGDNRLSGDELTNVSIWNDRNGNAISEAGEVQSVHSHGIVSLKADGQRHPSGILYSPQGVNFKDGSVAPSFDIILEEQGK
jgi:tetratricopeptide (TPR) repeat protein